METVQKISAAISVILTLVLLGAFVFSLAASSSTKSGDQVRCTLKHQ